MRSDLRKILKDSYLYRSDLSTFQKILLTTDGTLTDILEVYLMEEVQVAKLAHESVIMTQDSPLLGLKKGSQVIDRKILLQGKESGKNFIYAESIIVPERLDKRVRNGLLKSKKPLGQLWLEYRIETFKEVVDSGKEPAGELAPFFNIEKEQSLFFRTYRVFSNQKAVMIITEKFPESYFLNGF